MSRIFICSAQQRIRNRAREKVLNLGIPLNAGIREYAEETVLNCVLDQKFGWLIKWKYPWILKDADDDDDKDESNDENFREVRQLCGKFGAINVMGGVLFVSCIF